MPLISREMLKQLRDNRNVDEPVPVVRLYNPYGNQYYILIAQDTDDRNKFLCIADIGYGPDFGYVSMAQLEHLESTAIPLVYDENETFDRPWPAYLAMARKEHDSTT